MSDTVAPAFPVDWSAPPDAIVAACEAAATRQTTPCGEGTIAWRRWGEPRLGRRPLVLLHGGTGSWTHWIKVLSDLAADTQVWCVDLPGLGDSAMPEGAPTPANSARALARGIRRLFGPDGQIDLVAFSFGAHVGTHLAAELGPHVGTFIICGCAAMGLKHNHIEFDKEHAGMSQAERNAVHASNLAKLMIYKPSRIDALAIHTHAENLKRARFRSRAFAATAEIPETLPKVTARLGAIWGAHDVIATPSVEARYEILRRSHPQLLTHTIADAGHWVAYEQPKPFVQAVRALMQPAT